MGSSKENKDEKNPPPFKTPILPESSIDTLMDLIIHSLKEENRSSLESFEIYTQRIRSHIYADMNEFRARFIKGYRVLVEELIKKTTDEVDKNV